MMLGGRSTAAAAIAEARASLKNPSRPFTPANSLGKLRAIAAAAATRVRRRLHLASAALPLLG